MEPAAAAARWADPDFTAEGKRRAKVELQKLETLWFNTGTLCNLACANCYIESTPKNDRLAFIGLEDIRPFLDEIEPEGLRTREIGFTGGEPFLNPALLPMLEECLGRGFETLTLTNAMRPMMLKREALLDLRRRFGARLRLRVSLDHYTREVHDAERGPGAWETAKEGLRWLTEEGFSVAAAGRSLTDEPEEAVREGYRGLFRSAGLGIDASDPKALILFPEMGRDEEELPEITTGCWGILGKDPRSVMCASSRMVIKRRGDAAPVVAACTLIAYDARFILGRTLKESRRPVSLVHPRCAGFCVLGGSSCSP